MNVTTRAFLVSALLLVADRAACQSFAFRNFEIPGAQATAAWGLNNVGSVVGTVWLKNNNGPYGFILSNDSLSLITPPEAKQTVCTAINDSNVIVGYYFTSHGAEYGFEYQDGVYTQISVPGSKSTYAEGVNNLREIVGGYHDHSDVEHGFLFDGSTYQTIDVPGAANCAALSINNDGDTTFQCSSYGLNGSVLYSGSTYIVLQYPGAVATYAYGLNDADDVALAWQDTAQNIHGGVFRNGSYVEISEPGCSQCFTNLLGINNEDDLVGTFNLPSSGLGIGFVASPKVH